MNKSRKILDVICSVVITICFVMGGLSYYYDTNYVKGFGLSNGEKYSCSYFKIVDLTYEKSAMVAVIDVNGNRMLKRIVGVPGDVVTVKSEEILVNNEFVRGRSIHTYDEPVTYELKEGEYFVLGDAEDSYDSAFFGPVKKEQIIGQRVFYKKMTSDDLDVKLMNFIFFTLHNTSVEKECSSY